MDVVEKSVARISDYTTLDTVKINTNDKSPTKIADEIIFL